MSLDPGTTAARQSGLSPVLFGQSTDSFPLLAERAAIDLSGALRSAEAGLRALRRRPLLRRIWESAAGQGQERQVALGADLVAAHRSTVMFLQEVMREEARSQYCVSRVLDNLHLVNAGMTNATDRVFELERATAEERARSEAWREEFGKDVEQLAGELSDTTRRLDRLDAIRHLTERYRAGAVSGGLGEIFGAAQFLAAVAWQCAGSPDEQAAEARETATAMLVVQQRLKRSGPYPVAEAVLDAAAGIQPEWLEGVLYLGQGSTGPLRAIVMLVERRAAGLPIDRTRASDAVAVTRALTDPDGRLAAHLIRPTELIEDIARALLPTDGVA